MSDNMTELEISGALILGSGPGDADTLYDAREMVGKACMLGLVSYVDRLKAESAQKDAKIAELERDLQTALQDRFGRTRGA